MVDKSRVRVRIGDQLVAQQYISQDDLELALKAQKQSGLKLGRQLIEMGLVEETTLLEMLSEQLKIPFIDLNNYPFDPEVVKRLPENLARRYRVILLSDSDSTALLGMSDPTDIFCLDDLQRVLQKDIDCAVVRESDLLDLLSVVYSRTEEIASLAEQLDEELNEESFDLTDIVADTEDSDAPVFKLLKTIFEEAINTNASDIHVEPDENVLRIRQRIDGVLVEQVMNEKRIAAALVVRLKLMSNLDISEKRLPQDGRFQLRLKNHNIDVRLSTLPVQFGESVVMRILDHTQGVLPLNSAGMPENYLLQFRKLLGRPHGLILVTGPTGSGKTTTLYGAISELNQPEKKIITVEDPVEYRLPRISQVQVHEKIGLDFSTVLRATLRQDPDILLVGEIRDGESAEIALRAAMTGHLVLSTLHTNDAVSSATRLIDMGVDPFLVASSLNAIVAQRLVRKICRNCSRQEPLSAQDLAVFRQLMPDYSETPTFSVGKGCPHCFNTGFRGRIGVFELLEINEEMAEALRNRDVSAFNLASKRQKQYRPLNLAALDYAIQGLTSFDEVLRVSAHVDALQSTS